MSKIPFDIKWKPQIESGEYKVKTKDGGQAEIVKWDLCSPDDSTPILAIIHRDYDYVRAYSYEGYSTVDSDRLFIIIPDEELTKFEIRLLDWLSDDTSGEISMERMKGLVKNRAAELLSLAREQFIKDGYIIEKKAFYDAVENIYDRNLIEVNIEWSLHCNIENGAQRAVMDWEAFQKVAKKFINIGMAEALKGSPKWEKWGNGACGNGRGIPLAIVYHQYG